jgi:hypothetical protein
MRRVFTIIEPHEASGLSRLRAQATKAEAKKLFDEIEHRLSTPSRRAVRRIIRSKK